MENVEEEKDKELEIAKAKELAYWEDQLMKCARGEEADHDSESIVKVLHKHFGWELPYGYEEACNGGA